MAMKIQPTEPNITESLMVLVVDIDSVKEDPRNARRHPTANLTAIKQSLTIYGQRKPIVVNEETGIIEAGNGLWKAAKLMGWTHIAAVKVKDDPASATGFAIMDNQSANLAEWDMPVLKDLLLELEKIEFEMDNTGFSTRDIEELLADVREPKPGLILDDDVPETEESICQPGDLWQLGEHRLLCGDSTDKADFERLMGIDRADLVITDPPYNVDYKSQAGHGYSGGKYGGKFKTFEDNKSLDGYHYFLTAVIGNIYHFTKEKAPVYMWHSMNYADLVLGTFRQYKYSIQPSIIWLKEHFVFSYSTYHRCYEPCAYCFKDGHKPYENKKATAKEKDVWMDRITFMDYVDVWFIQRDNTNEYVHPTQKPVALTERMLRNSSQRGDIILDTFGGSGSVLIGCEKSERKCRMLELDPHYCDVIINRWEKYTGNKAERIESRQKTKTNEGTAGANLPVN
ncbi:MAG: DNA modification methylase [Actinobacteria bacterium]|nr:DNA modification methylase [Actinomycetota bacterium]